MIIYRSISYFIQCIGTLATTWSEYYAENVNIFQENSHKNQINFYLSPNVKEPIYTVKEMTFRLPGC